MTWHRPWLGGVRGWALALVTAGAALAPPSPAAAQGRYVPQGSAQREFQEGERLQQSGDKARDDGDTEAARKHWRDAARAFGKAVEADPAYIEAYVRLGVLYYSLEEPAEVIDRLIAALERAPDNIDLQFWLGQNLIRAERGDEGVRHLERVAAESDRFPEVYVVLGNHYYTANDHRRALPAYERYLQLKPDATSARARLGNTYFKLGRYREALTEFQAVQRDWPDSVSVLVNVGNAHFKLGQHEDAIAALNEALRRDPERTSALFNLAQSHFALGRHAEAVPNYERFVAANSQSFNGHYFLGVSLMELGRTGPALAALERAHALKPSQVHPLYKQGLIHLQAGNPEAALTALGAARERAPEDPWVLSALGTVARQRGAMDEARALHRRAAERAPDQPRLHANLALTELAAGDPAAAEAAMERALKLGSTRPPDHWIDQAAARVLAAQAERLLAAGDVEGARARLDRALARRPGEPSLLVGRALTRLRQGDDPGAAADLDAIDAANTPSASPHAPPAPDPATQALRAEITGRLALRRGDLDAARRAFAQANALAPHPRRAAAEAVAQLRQGDVDAAADALEQAAAADPADAEVTLAAAVARAHRAAGRVAKGAATAAVLADLKAALAVEDRLDALTAARLRYAAFVTALRRGDAAGAAAHLPAVSARFAEVRRQGLGDPLTRRTPARHLDLLTAHLATLQRRYDRAEVLLEPLKASKKRGTPEARLRRVVVEQLGLARLEANDPAGAARRFQVAQTLEPDAVTEHNLALTEWQRGRKPKAEKTWRAVSGQVPEALFNLGVAADAAGRHQEAHDFLRRYARAGGRHADKARAIADAKQRIFGFGDTGEGGDQ